MTTIQISLILRCLTFMVRELCPLIIRKIIVLLVSECNIISWFLRQFLNLKLVFDFNSLGTFWTNNLLSKDDVSPTWQRYQRWFHLQFKTYFSNIVDVSFLHKLYIMLALRMELTLWKSQINFITWACIQYNLSHGELNFIELIAHGDVNINNIIPRPRSPSVARSW